MRIKNINSIRLNDFSYDSPKYTSKHTTTPLGTIAANFEEVNLSSPVNQAKIDYKDEYEQAKYKYCDSSKFVTIQDITIANKPAHLLHIISDDPSNLWQVENANGEYGSGEETVSSMAKRKNALFAINGAHFDMSINGHIGTGKQDLNELNTIAIYDGKLIEAFNNNESIRINDENQEELLNVQSKGTEICIFKDGTIGCVPNGTTAREMIEMGVIHTLASFDNHLIENGIIQTSQNRFSEIYEKYANGTATINEKEVIESWNTSFNNTHKDKTIIAMKKPGEYYILIGDHPTDDKDDTHSFSNIEAATYLNNLGCTFAKSLDQGGSSAMVFQNERVDTYYNDYERPVGNCLYVKLQ